MGFAEIQAAFAAQSTAGAQAALQPMQVPAPAAPPAFAPSPFAAAGTTVKIAAQPFQVKFPQPGETPGNSGGEVVSYGAALPLDQAVALAASAPAPQQAFTFTPPASFNPASAPPINPPGERAALTVPVAAPIAATVGNVTVTDVGAPAPEPEQPKAKRGRKPKAEQAPAVPPADCDQAPCLGSPGPGCCPSLAAEGAALAELPADGSSVEDIVAELFARGVSSVHLTFTKDGK